MKAFTDVRHARQYAEQGSSVQDQLPYLGFRQGIALNRDNTIEFGLWLHPRSAVSVSPDVRGSISEAARIALLELPTGARLRLFIRSLPATNTYLDRYLYRPERPGNEALALIHDSDQRVIERLRDAEQLSETSLYLTVRLPMPARLKGVSYTAEELARIEKAVLDTRGSLVRKLRSGACWAEPMTTKDLFDAAFTYLNPSLAGAKPPEYQDELDTLDLMAIQDARELKKKGVKAALPPHAATLRRQLGATAIDFSEGVVMLMDDRFVSTVSINKPGKTTPGISEKFMRALAGAHYHLVFEYTTAEQGAIRARLNEAIENIEYAASDTSMKPGREVMLRAGQATETLHEIERGEMVGEFSCSCVLVATSEAELRRRREAAVSVLSDMNFNLPVVSSAQNVWVYLSLVPFGGGDHPYKVPAYSRNFSDCLPQVAPWPGMRGALYTMRGRAGNLIGLNPSDNTLNYGVLFLGSSGAGKSFKAQKLLSSLAVSGARGVILDMKRGYETTIQALGGVTVPFMPGGKLTDGRLVCVNIFDLTPGETEPDAVKMGVLEGFFSMLGLVASGSHKTIIRGAVEQFYLKHSRPVKGIENRREYTGGTLSDFKAIVRQMRSVGNEALSPKELETAREVSFQLEAYCKGSYLGDLLDGETTVDFNADHVYVDASALDGDETLKRIALLLITQLIWTRAKADRKVKYCLIEELGVMSLIPGVSELVTTMYKLAREYNLWPVAISQEMMDIASIKGVVNSAAVVIVGSMLHKEAEVVVRELDLPAAAVDLIGTLGGEMGRYREYLLLKRDASTNAWEGDVAQLWPSRESYWLYTTRGEEVEKRKALALETGSLTTAALLLARMEGQHVQKA